MDAGTSDRKRQLICMGFAASIGVPFYFLTRETLGTSNAAAGMVLLMLPEFFFALFEKNGMHLETILTNFINVRFKRPAVRRYEIENLYEYEPENTIIPFKDKFDTSLKLYGLMTTKPNEIAKYREKKDA